MSVEIALQTALYTALNGDAGLGAVITGVYDRAPQAADSGDASAFPYIILGDTILTIDDTDTSTNFNALTRLHTWSRTGSKKECKEIQALIFNLLHDASLTVTGWNCYSVLREDSRSIWDDDGQVHGICEYRILLQST